MKKKLLTTMLALVMSASAATAMAGCNNGDDGHTHTFASEWTTDDTYHWHVATCEHTTEVSDKAAHNFENDICAVCQKVKPTDGDDNPSGGGQVSQVTEQVWNDFFNNIDNMSYYVQMSGEQGSVSYTYTFGKNDDVFYLGQTQSFNGSEMSVNQYASFDDDNLSISVFSNQTGTWQKNETTYQNNNLYEEAKAQYSIVNDGPFSTQCSTEIGGEEFNVSQLYSAFTDKGNGSFSADLYTEVYMGPNEPVNSEITWLLNFENGKIVSGQIIQTVDEATASISFTIAYDGFEIVIPDEALNAGSQN